MSELFDPDQPDTLITVGVSGAPRFAQIPEWVVQEGTDRAVAVWCVLWLMVDWRIGSGRVPRQKIADAYGKSLKSTDRALRDLETIGALSIRHADFAGRQGWSEYTLHWHPPSVTDLGGTDVTTRGRHICPPGGDTCDHPYSYVRDHIEESGGGGAAAYDAKAVEAVLRRWWELKGVPATNTLMRRWWPVTAEWIRVGGDVSDEFLTGAANAGITYPAGWGHYALSLTGGDNGDRPDRWAGLDEMIDATAKGQYG